MNKPLLILTALSAALSGSTALACATCGCSLSTDAAAGYSSTAGWRISLEYDDINQNQLRLGNSVISRASVAAVNDAGGSQEVENGTHNRYLTLGLSYAPSADWGFKLQVPYIDRSHSTYGASTNPLTADNLSSVSIQSLGDVKLLASYQGWLPTHNLGLQVGLKLPSGNYGGPNADGTGTVGRNPAAFSAGPNAQLASPANLVDTSLQAGTGSTDLIVGAYYYQPVSQDFDFFVNAQHQFAVAHLSVAGADYRPGDASTVSLGLRYEANPDVVPQLQLNISHKSSDQGALADRTDSAGTVAYLSPGVSVKLNPKIQVFGFVQVPVLAHLQGYQLFPHWTASLGLGYGF